MSPDLKRIVSSRLKSARVAVGLSQEEVAEKLEIDRKSYNHLETGRNSLSVEHLVKLPAIFDCEIAYLLGMGTKELDTNEVELIELYRALPEGSPHKEHMLMFLRGFVEQAKLEEE